jgi:hypothetical protein
VVIGARWATAAGGRAGYNSAVQSSSSLTYINTQTPAGAALGDLVSGSTLDTFTDGDLHVDDDLDIDGDAAVNGDLTVIGEGNITGGITSGGDMNPNTGDILARITSTARAYRIMGEKLTGISEDTFFDILTFTATSAIGTSYFGVLSGFLTVIVRQRNTDGLARWRAETFKLSVGPTSGVSALTSALTSLDSDSVGTVNLTVQQKAGATTTSLTIEAKFSIEVGKWGAVPACMWWLEVMSQGYNTSNYLIVPAVV